MRVILRRAVKGVGAPGEVKDVADGYARNYLLPRGLAVEATAGALRSIEQQRELARAREERERAETKVLAERLERTRLTFSLKSGTAGRVFGSVTNRDIADGLAARGLMVDRAKVHLEEPLRSLGTHEVEVRLLPDVRARLVVQIEPAS